MKKFVLKNAEIEKRTHPEFFKIAISVDCVIFCYDKKKIESFGFSIRL